MFLVLGILYVSVTTTTSRNYYQEVNQRLSRGIAEHLVGETTPILNGEADKEALHDIMHSMMVINPSVEVYILDTTGQIIDYVVPFNEVKLERVNLQPVKKFIETKGEEYIIGDDPKSLTVCNTFSAAAIKENDRTIGYAYIILAGQDQQEISATLLGSYFLKSGTRLFLASMIAAALVGLLAIWLITRNLRKIIEAVRRFKEGDMTARAPETGDGELQVLSSTFNEMADTLVANIEELKSVENLRRELIANVSHDLRTPLAVMQGYIETLSLKEDSLTSEERQRYLEVVLESSKKLSKMIAQLFEYSKLEAKQIRPEKESFFLSELAHDVSQNYQILAREKDIDIQLEIPEKLPLVFADIGLVERVLQNLMDNALKFTPNGGTITIQLTEKAKSVEVKVADSGPGIPEEEQTAIFDRFHQTDYVRTEQKKGGGLGLAIVKNILDLHDATIRVQSRLNEGTSFMFELPATA